ncbi:MAG: class I SAM-dependent methyltransferase [Syntrophaceae bacterium]|nr:class I SAM-dependent methyltransferase [Syntrophaceae bacterium]
MGKKGVDKRFEFGKNWRRFLSILDEERIMEAQKSLKRMLDVDHLNGKSFLDIGCGSGLFSLAARRLGAKVHSFDYDPLSVACTEELKRRYFPDDPNWSVERGDVLDKAYLESLGQFDIVYAWGVLHHTGAMWQAMENVAQLVNPGGKLFISIYNDQGNASSRWTMLKKFYNQAPNPIKSTIVLSLGCLWVIRSSLIKVINFQNPLPFKEWNEKKKNRGMSFWHDLVDWVGGYPFEVAKPEGVFNFYYKRGFELTKLKTCGGGLGCNEFVFVQKPKPLS